MATDQRPTAIVKRAEDAPSILQRVELAPLAAPQALELIRAAAPGVEIERVFAEVLLAMHQNPKLQECTPVSLATAVAKAVGWGLTIGEKVHLVPFNVKVRRGNREEWEHRAQAVRDYKGDAELVISAGGARFIDAFSFYENEVSGGHFQHEQGSEPFVRHRPLPPSKRGKLAGSYAVAVIGPNIPKKIVVMYREEIEEVKRKHSKQWKTKKVNGVEVDLPLEDVPWYGPKTCVHRVCKLLPTNPRMQRVMQQLDEELASFEVAEEPAAIAAGAEPPAAPAPTPATSAAEPGDESDEDQHGMRF